MTNKKVTAVLLKHLKNRQGEGYIDIAADWMTWKIRVPRSAMKSR